MRNEKRQEKRMQTELTRLLGIQAPIIQGGMAWVAEHTLAAAVSNAGGLGIIGAANAPAEWVREQIRLTKQLTDKPFGVNVMLMSPYAPEIAQVVAEEGVSVVTTGAGNPESYMALWKSKGIKGDSSRCIRCFSKKNGASRSRCCCCRRM